MKVAVMGIGNVRCAPPVIASLSNYFGERPLELCLWDADFERLDLFDRFARLCFHMTESKHNLIATDDSEEALANAQGLILCVEENCATKFLKARGSLLGHGETEPVLVNRCVSELMLNAPLEASVFSLIDVEPDGRPWVRPEWPEPKRESELSAVPHQILRYLNGGDYAHGLLQKYKTTPLSDWLDRLTDRAE